MGKHIWVSMGLLAGAWALTACSEDLAIDGGVLYRCQNASQCGLGFVCEDLGLAQGKVCIDPNNPPDALVGAETDSDVTPQPDADVAAEIPLDVPAELDQGPEALEVTTEVPVGDIPDTETTDLEVDGLTDAPDADDIADDGDVPDPDAPETDLTDTDGDIPDPCQNVICDAPFSCVNGFCVDGDGMVPVAAGDFYMGCNQASGINACIASTNQPQLKITFPASYAIDQFETTAAEYVACWAATVCSVPANLGAEACSLEPDGSGGVQAKLGREQHPANCITQTEAQVLCESQGKRLCTEAEWEKAARGGCEFHGPPCPSNMPRYPWSDGADDEDDAPDCTDLAHFTYPPAGGNGCGTNTPADVGSYPGGVSAYGLYDTAGNVGEIVADCWHNSLDGIPQDGSEWTINCIEAETRRGGSYLSNKDDIRGDHRINVSLGSASPQHGVRCCRD